MARLHLSVTGLWLIWLSLSALTFFLFWAGIGSGFLFDDAHTVDDNELIRITELGWDQLISAMVSFRAGGREFSMLSFALNHYILGDDASAYKIVNIAIHCLIGGVMLILLRKLIDLKTEAKPVTPVLYWLPVLVVAGWMIHPMNLTSVLYISQRMTQLAMLFILLGCWLYTLGRQRQFEGDLIGWLYILAGMLGCGSAAYFSKQNGVLLFPLLALIEMYLFRFMNPHGSIDRVIVIVFLIVLGMPVVGVGLILVLEPDRLLGAYSIRPFDLMERLLTQARAMVFYLTNLLFPRAEVLSLWHDDFVISRSLLNPPATLAAVIGMLCMLGLIPLLWIRAPLIAFGLAWFLISHSLESTIFPLELVHEHRNYLAGPGVILVISVLLLKTIKGRFLLRLALLLSLFGYFATQLHARSYEWRSPGHVILNAYQNNPNSPAAVYRMGLAYQKMVAAGNDELLVEMNSLMRRAAELDEFAILPEISHLIYQLVYLPDYDLELLDRAADKLRLYPGIPSSGLALQAFRRCRQAGDCEVSAVELEPLYEAAHQSDNIPIQTEAAFFYQEIGRYEEALALFEDMRRRKPGDYQNQINYIWGLIHVGELDEAEHRLQELKSRNTVKLKLWEGPMEKVSLALTEARARS